MSGGHFDYNESSLCTSVFGWGIYMEYGLDRKETKENSRIAGQINPLEDRQISELVYDVLCLIRSYDYYKSGDTGEELYRSDVAYFKKKWLETSKSEIDKRTVDNILQSAKEEIYKTIGFERKDAENETV